MSTDWWRSAVIYQIYPRSFQDTNNDGIGDLIGIIKHLPYIASLGVDAIWISPFFPSPMKDFGYDVSNYRDIDPLFGTLSDFNTLIMNAHDLGLKVIIDLVLSHTSDQHPWFQDESKKDWYVWADIPTDKNLPNNWVSVFGGPAWTYDERYGQYYLHNFLKEQPDLNFHNPQVQDEILDICRFWLDHGVDGFRLDVVNFYFHDPLLRDNPTRITQEFATQLEADVPYSRQQHIYDKSRPENLAFLERLRNLTDEYPSKVLIGEIGDDDPYLLSQSYTKGEKRLHTAYNPQMMSGIQKELTTSIIRDPIDKFSNQTDLDKESDRSWPSWAFSNHDVVRAASRWFQPFKHDPRLSKMLIALLGCLPGTLFLYQGEELGLPEAKIPPEIIQDPWAKETFPFWQGRDGCRTPIPWDSSLPNCGFSNYKPWLPIPHEHLPLCVRDQDSLPESCLNFTRHFLKWRKRKPSLLQGKHEFIDTRNFKILDFIRFTDKEKTRCLFNMCDKKQIYLGQQLEAYSFQIDDFNN